MTGNYNDCLYVVRMRARLGCIRVFFLLLESDMKYNKLWYLKNRQFLPLERRLASVNNCRAFHDFFMGNYGSALKNWEYTEDFTVVVHKTHQRFGCGLWSLSERVYVPCRRECCPIELFLTDYLLAHVKRNVKLCSRALKSTRSPSGLKNEKPKRSTRLMVSKEIGVVQNAGDCIPYPMPTLGYSSFAKQSECKPVVCNCPLMILGNVTDMII